MNSTLVKLEIKMKLNENRVKITEDRKAFVLGILNMVFVTSRANQQTGSSSSLINFH